MEAKGPVKGIIYIKYDFLLPGLTSESKPANLRVDNHKGA
jgi:hypothetical protein